MATSVIMPKAGMAMETGTILRWLKKVGDPVTVGEPILEIQTDKVAMEVEAEVSGFLIEILHKEGDEVPVTTPIGTIGAKGEKPQAAAPAAGEPAATVPTAAVAVAKAADSKPAAGAAPSGPAGSLMATPAARARAAELGVSLESAQPTGTSGEIKLRDIEALAASSRGAPVSPLARKIAEQGGVDAASLTGTGPGGRVVRQDVERALGGVTGLAAAAPAASVPGADVTRTPLIGTRKIIAQRMLQSHLSIPQVTLDAVADVTSLLALRGRINEDVAASRANADAAVKFSVNDFILKAVAKALVDSPYVLRSIDGDSIVQYNAINVGMAVATDAGLLVPVVRGADKLTLSAIAAQTSDLARRARDKKLKPDEMSGGTFTVTNLGMYGITSFTPLVNPPEGAILGVNAARTEVYLEAGQPKERKVMTLSLSIDHRVIDGAQGALFLQKLVALLENPYRILV